MELAQQSVQRYLQYMQDMHYSDNTVKSYTFALTRLVGALGADAPVDAITPDVLEVFAATLRCQSPRTQHIRLAAVSSFLRWAVKRRLIARNPADAIDRPRCSKGLPKPLTVEACRRLIAQPGLTCGIGPVTQARDTAILGTLYGAGLRVSELADLHLDDLEETPQGAILRVRSGKGAKARRVPIRPATYALLRGWTAVRPTDSPFANIFLAIARPHGPLYDHGVRELVERYGTLACVGHVTPHMLRHSYATHLIAQGAPVVAVSRAMGHESIQTTMRYVEVAAAEMRAAVDLLPLPGDTK